MWACTDSDKVRVLLAGFNANRVKNKFFKLIQWNGEIFAAVSTPITPECELEVTRTNQLFVAYCAGFLYCERLFIEGAHEINKALEESSCAVKH